MVVNAGCREKDLAHLDRHLAAFRASKGDKVSMHIHDERALIALQGPKAAAAVQARLAPPPPPLLPLTASGSRSPVWI